MARKNKPSRLLMLMETLSGKRGAAGVAVTFKENNKALLFLSR